MGVDCTASKLSEGGTVETMTAHINDTYMLSTLIYILVKLPLKVKEFYNYFCLKKLSKLFCFLINNQNKHISTCNQQNVHFHAMGV